MLWIGVEVCIIAPRPPVSDAPTTAPGALQRASNHNPSIIVNKAKLMGGGGDPTTGKSSYSPYNNINNINNSLMFFVRTALFSGFAEAAKLTIKKAQLMARMVSIYFSL